MAYTGFPTSSDIYIEAGDRKVAVVQSYRARSTRPAKNIEAFGEHEPVGTVGGMRKYTIELSRLYATDEAISDGIDFYSLEDFNLVIVKPDRRILYTGCQWSDITESGKIGDMVTEKVTVTAAKRREIR